MVRPTHLPMEMLLRFLEENPGIAKGYMRTSQAKHETKIKWDRIAVELNSIGGAIKDGKAWAKVWTDKKYTLKKIIARRNSSTRHTGGGVDIVPPLTELDEKLLGILGGTSFALGNSDVSVPLSVSIELKEGPQEDAFIQEPQVNAHAQEIQSSPTRSPRRRRTQRLEKEKERLVRIEEKRVEAELKAAAGWESVAGGLQSLADSIRVAGEKTEKGLQAIADAIMTAAAAKNS